MQTKHIVIVVVVVAVVAGIWLVAGGKSGSKGAKDKGGSEALADGENGAGGKNAPIVKREEALQLDKDKAQDPNLALPGNLPSLKGVQGNDPNAAAEPTQPHGRFELEGQITEQDAEAAVKAVFAPIRDCYAELRQRAPQAKGRMLMKFAVRPGTEPGKAAMGDLFLKETQFTDPKYLTCVRAAIDNTKVGGLPPTANGSVTVPMILSPEDVGQKP